MLSIYISKSDNPQSRQLSNFHCLTDLKTEDRSKLKLNSHLAFMPTNSPYHEKHGCIITNFHKPATYLSPKA
ncbi:MAG TPA: hypothetical protein DEQ87_20925 [Algoriphagus sp.]|nr:hypothetical protein [Algoriphagus sp.]MAL14941.1 hypothetical protein [Algoriphagus sp.]MAN88846.1 hypothetical protein [Algoriphagus sp.]HAH38915.1 hypothetical protein [Algoriphagus sp.]HAZ23525.1 hypothetical protein [Algoriphagus sp.]